MTSSVLLRNSERGTFKTCRFRWGLNYGLLAATPLRSREPAKALWFGDLVHQGLAAYYRTGTKRGPKPSATFRKLYDADERISAVLRNDEGEWESMRDLGIGMLDAFVETYADRDEEWEVVSSEQTFRLPLRVPELRIVERPGVSIVLPAFRLTVVGTFDGLWRNRSDRDRLVFKEHKTASSISLDGLPMDDQAGFYWTYGPRWLWRQGLLPEKTYPTEILYTFLRKAVRDPAGAYDSEGRKLNKPTKEALANACEDAGLPKTGTVDELTARLSAAKIDSRQLGEISKSQPPAYFERQPIYRDEADRRNLHERVLEEAREMMLARHGILSPIKNPGPLHMPNCRGCSFRDACELHETGHDWEAMLRVTTEPWDPYSQHEIVERR